jgi:translation initiation factor 2 subunit 2
MNYEKMLKEVMAKLPTKARERKRFEVPKAQIKVSGVKTRISNFNELLSTLRRQPQHMAKFIAKQLATAGWIEGGELILQGNIRSQLIQQKVEQYVQSYVLCKACKNPDTKLVKEGRLTFLRCEACGCRYPVEKV